MTSLLIRADANVHMGTGHIMRCLALAQAWQAEARKAHFALAQSTPALAARLRDEGFELHHLTASPGSLADAAQTIALAQALKATWVVADGYHFDAAYQQALKQADLRLLVADDYGHANHYQADLILNQNLYADASLYSSREPYTGLLLGTQYALLRREFWPWRGWRREIASVGRKVLVTLGGADSANVTLKVIEALQQTQIDGLEAIVVVGNSNPHRQILRAAVETSQVAIRLQHDVTNMPELMAWADVAISAGGSTCWELAFMGLPHLILILADNQQQVAKSLDTADVAVNLGQAATLSTSQLAHALTEFSYLPEQRAVSRQQGQELVDGCGSTRVMQQMLARSLTLRLAQIEDSRRIWEWANDPSTRRNSFSTEPIPWEAHLTWFQSQLTNPHCLFYLACDATASPIGQIRYQLDGPEAVISVGLAPDQHSRGYGSQLIRLASARVFTEKAINLIHAYIKPDNLASIRAFSKAGFVSHGPIEVQGHQALHLTLQRNALP